MSHMFSNLAQSLDKRQEQSLEVMGKLFGAAQPGAVYGEPVVSGNYTVIPACEVAGGGGFGFGGGFGPAPAPTAGETPDKGEPQSQRPVSGGGGTGGGGGSTGRPVAVIIIGPEGVAVRPVVDVTKITLAFLTAWGAMLMMLGKMRRAGGG
ncbi:MAG: hypothetical protein FJ026_01035 [Chloroflexi bacterium]|nr:hypothetical protein [Chloroflexota bacterium]MBM4428917.1 hypothetical protein [Chloroflexota bacterium]